MTNRLLDNISYISRKPRTEKDLANLEITVEDTFPYNPESKSSPETAKRWAQSGYYYYSKENDSNPQAEPETHANTPFRVKIVSLEVRSEGGRAYKVVDEKCRQFDLREDQLIEAINLCGIEPGGDIPGDFVWGVSGSQVKMVLVGGNLHKEMSEYAHEVKTSKAISMSDYVPGRVYRKRDGSLFAYIGRVTHPDLDGTYHATMFIEREDGILYYNHYDHNDPNGPRTTNAPEGTTLLQQELLRDAYKMKEYSRTTYTWRPELLIQKTLKAFDVLDEENDVSIVKNNVAIYSIHDGTGASIPEKVIEKKTGIKRNEPRYWDYTSSWNSSQSGYDKALETFKSEVQKTRLEFIEKLVWK